VTSVKCYRCQGMGHIAIDCGARGTQSDRGRKPTCVRCHKAGHNERDCRAGGSLGNLQ
jgi:hypothetical protein